MAALTRAKRECFQRAEILQEQHENQQTMSQELMAECRLLLSRAEMEQYERVHNRLVKEVWPGVRCDCMLPTMIIAARVVTVV